MGTRRAETHREINTDRMGSGFLNAVLAQESHWLKRVAMPQEHIPVCAREDARIGDHPHPIQCADDIDLTQAIALAFDGS